MSLQNLKNQKGFTIVELLIVIVVIGILAAIVIVAYAGVTQKANTASAQGNAEAVQKVAEAYNVDNATYPEDPDGAGTDTVVDALTGYKGTTQIPEGVTIQTAAPTDSNGKDHVSYTVSEDSGGTVNGGCVGYYDFTDKAVKFVSVGAGVGSISGTTITCSGT